MRRWFPRRLGLFVLCQLATSFALAAPPVLLVRGTVSTPNEAERNYAARLTRTFSRRLDTLGIAHRTVDDEAMGAALEDAQLAILPYNPSPPRPQLAALERFIDRGGKLMVFYSASPALAQLLQMRLGRYLAAPAGGRWSRIVFNASAPPGIPESVRQESRNIRPVYPATPAAQVIAYWANADAKTASEPAWVTSKHGAWMSHVLLDDGDDAHKQQMLLALIASYVPEVMRHAAARSMQNLCRFDASTDFRTLFAELRRNNDTAPRRQRRPIASLLKRAASLHAHLVESWNERRYTAVVGTARLIEAVLLEAFARAQSPRKQEIRGMWEHSGLGLYPGDWLKTTRFLKEQGITDLFVNVAWPGATHYPSTIVPSSDLVALHGDQLRQCVTAAHKSGIRLHAWKVCWNLSEAPPAFVERLRRENRLQVTADGQTRNWLCPSNLDNLRLEKDMIREIIRSAPVDGIHLDYIRYPDSESCYCTTCRRHFEEALGRSVANWPAAVQEGALLERYRTWRAGNITRLVRDARALLRDHDRKILLTAAVYGRYPLCIASVAQDWGRWLREELVDFVCPMNYTADMNHFEAWLDEQIVLPNAGTRLLPGIGVTANESKLNAYQVIRQINAVHHHNLPGYVLFELNRTTRDDLLPYLGMGITGK